VNPPPPSGFALYRPRAVSVRTHGGTPSTVGRARVEAVREEWLIEDRWWTPTPLRRHYFELVLTNGHCLTVFKDLTEGSWYEHRA
jgi:hypothetical protein